jgi:hypothetical protein
MIPDDRRRHSRVVGGGGCCGASRPMHPYPWWGAVGGSTKITEIWLDAPP